MFRKVRSEGYHTAALPSERCLCAVIKLVQVEAFPCLSLKCLCWMALGSPGHGHGLEYGHGVVIVMGIDTDMNMAVSMDMGMDGGPPSSLYSKCDVGKLPDRCVEGL